MIIYNKTWLNNLYVHEQAEQEKAAGRLTKAEVDAIKQAYPVGFYKPGLFARIGIFILTFIVVCASAGLLTLMANSLDITNSFGWFLFLAILSGSTLEIMVRSKNHYRSGADDALLWMTGLFLAVSFNLLVEKITDNHKIDSLALSCFILAGSVIFTLRYLDRVMSAVACSAIFAVIFFAVQKLGPVGEASMPFVMIIASGVVYITGIQVSRQLTAPYHVNSLIWAQVVSLLVLYAAGNYYVVDRLNNVLKDLPGTSGNIALGQFFWAWTMVLPIAYLLRGLFKKDVILIRLGLLLIGAAVCTFRYYYHIVSPEAALSIGGTVILVLSYYAIQYLKTPKHGFTYNDTGQSDLLDNIKVEALITAGTLNHTAPTAEQNRFGGGNFGGGGSSGGY